MKKLLACVVLVGCADDVVYRDVEVPVPIEIPVPVDVYVPVAPTPEAPVKCQVWLNLNDVDLSQVVNTSQYLALVHSTLGDVEIGLNSISLTEEPDDSKPFIEFIEAGAEDITKNFSIRCEFLFEVKNAGNHIFSLESDDGSRLFINGVQIIDNGGAHGMVLKTATVSLPVGIHQMRVLYYEGSGPKGLSLKVQKPAIIQPVEEL